MFSLNSFARNIRLILPSHPKRARHKLRKPNPLEREERQHGFEEISSKDPARNTVSPCVHRDDAIHLLSTPGRKRKPQEDRRQSNSYAHQTHYHHRGRKPKFRSSLCHLRTEAW